MNSTSNVTVACDILSYGTFVKTLIKTFTDSRLELCHAGLGVTGEAGELADALKRIAIYGNSPEQHRENIIEELGDLNFFMTDIQNKFSISDHEVLSHNVAKLSKRYEGLKYSDKAATERKDKI